MIHIFITGDVQGVGFRQYIKYQARKLNVKGWVKNLPDGRVEGMLAGQRPDLDILTEYCRKGPFLAKVIDVEIQEVEDKDFDSFEIIR